VNILALFIFAFVIFAFIIAGIIRRVKKSGSYLERLELAKRLGVITDEELESMNKGHEPYIESCIISSDELMEAIESSINPLRDLENLQKHKGNERWTQDFGIQSSINLTLKELTILNMKLGNSYKAMDIITEVIAMNIPIDAIEAGQERGKGIFPNYRAIARMLWIQIRKCLEGPISDKKKIYNSKKDTPMTLIPEFTTVIMKTLNMPSTSAGLAVVIALIIAKVEFSDL